MNRTHIPATATPVAAGAQRPPALGTEPLPTWTRDDLLAMAKRLPIQDMLHLAKECIWAVAEEVCNDLDLSSNYRDCEDSIDAMSALIAEHRSAEAAAEYAEWKAELASDYRGAVL